MKLKNIKDSFNEREIQPSAGSWEKLSAQLDGQEKKKKKPYLYWIGAVAALLLIALMVYPAFNNATIKAGDQTSQMVEVNTTEPELQNSSTETIVMDINKTALSNNEVEGDEIVVTNVSNKKPTAKAPQKVLNRAVVNSVPVKKETSAITAMNAKGTVMVESIAQNEVAQLTAEQEADLLLNSLLNNNQAKENVASYTIQPKQLLRETEWDIEADRRNQLNNELKKGLGKLKTEAFALIGVDN